MTTTALPTSTLPISATATSATDADLTWLSGQLEGPLLVPGTPAYDAEVAGFNLAHTPRPALVVAARSAADVGAAVAFGHRHGLRVVAQATGHGLVDDREGTLMVSTRSLTGVEVLPERRTAWVAAGCRWREVVEAAAPYGLAPLSGSSSNVGAVGYTLGGGIGLLARRYGFAADHVRSLTLVTADGVVRQVDRRRHPDLFWAVRGGKVGFGIVTEMEIDLVEVARFHGGGLFYPGAQAGAVLEAWRTWSAGLPEEVTTSIALLRLPADPHLPPPLSGQFVVHVRYAHLGEADEAEQLLAPMRAAAPVLVDTVGELPYAAADAVHMDPPTPMPCYDHGLALDSLTRDTVDTLVDAAGPDSDSVLTAIELRLLGGALALPAASPYAVVCRHAAYGVYVLGVPAGPAAAMVPAQVEAVVAALEPWRRGALVNFLGAASRAEWRAAWSEADRTLLATVARQHDPDDVFGGTALFG